MRLFCRKCDKEIPEYKIEIIKQDNGLYMHMITVECHGKGWLRCFEDRHGPGFNTVVYENVYFFEKEESHTNWAAFKECTDILKRANIRNELGNCAEMIDREYNRVVAENEELKNTERKAVKKTVDLHLKCMALEEQLGRVEKFSCCKQWKDKTFRRYLEFKDCKVPYIDNKFTFCPECGEKL